MINKELINPGSIAVIGASNNLSKLGGKVLKNLIDNKFAGRIYPVNPNDSVVQGMESLKGVEQLPQVDLAVLAIPAHLCPEAVDVLVSEKRTRAFIIFSAGFGETGAEGKKLEEKIVLTINNAGATLVGPNCIGVMTPFHASVFTSPVPALTPAGCDFISESGATAVFIIESGMPKGLRFANVFSVGNSAQTGIEDLLEYFDDNYVDGVSPKVKLLYMESIRNPDKLLFHASSLIKKGCRIAAIKAGTSKSGSRAASSHTGAMTSSDSAVEALFRKAGIVRCYGREELVTVANVLFCKELKNKRLAIITHAGGPGVMLADALEDGGLKIPHLPDTDAKRKLKENLFPGSSVENPIDFLATGTGDQLETIIDACENDFEDIDGMAVIFGSSGLFPVRDVYEVLDRKMHECKKPIYPILPSVIDVKDDVTYFLSHGNVNFPDEVLLGRALTKVINTPGPSDGDISLDGIDVRRIRKIIDNAENGYLSNELIHSLFECAGIPVVKEIAVHDETSAVAAGRETGFPLVMKVVGPLHKTEVGGVVLNIRNEDSIRKEFAHLMKIPDAKAVIVSQMAFGTELFIGANYEPRFGHVILCGLGGIYVEVMKDVTSGLAPLTIKEALSMIRNLKSYRIIKGYRGKSGVDVKKFAEIIVRLSSLLRFAVEIKEMDINPLIGKGTDLLAVDARIRIEK
jgi:acetate---CoA ligase (ADP-forming)